MPKSALHQPDWSDDDVKKEAERFSNNSVLDESNSFAPYTDHSPYIPFVMKSRSATRKQLREALRMLERQAPDVQEAIAPVFHLLVEAARLGNLAEVVHVLEESLAETAIRDGHPPLPRRARVRFSQRKKFPALARLNIMDFLRAEYGPWLDGTLTRAKLRELDPSAEMAVANWLRHQPLPDDIKLPKRSEVLDQILSDPERVREAYRLSRAAFRRHRRQRAPG